jgi:soluble lytic murein transglycosylase-like protein
MEGTQGSGCLSGFAIPPLAVLLVSCLLAAFAMRHPLAVRAVSVQVAEPVVLIAPTADPTDAIASPAPTPFFILTPTYTPAAPELPRLFAFAPADLSPSSGLAAVFTPEVQYWGEAIIRWAAAAAVDPNLVAVVMQIESCGDPRALSRSGAIGLFQVMPFHFYATDNPYDPDTNALRGLDYLARSLTSAGGNARLALAGYNGGIGVIAQPEWMWSAQTDRYVHYGAAIYEDARQGLSTSPMLDDWYSTYGASLCRQAHERIRLP